MRFFRIFAALLAFGISSCLAQSHPILAYDISPPDMQCTPGVPRNCYLPAPNVWGPVNPTVGGPSVTHAYAQFTLANPQWIEASFDALFFLSAGGEYTAGIGVDGFDAAHLCPQFAGGLTNDNTKENGSPPNIYLSLTSRAVCLIQLPAGVHTIYAMEYSRPGTSSFRGPVNQSLIVRFY